MVMLKVFSSLRAHVLLLIGIPFAVMLGMIIYETLGEREERLADARDRLIGTTRLMAAEQWRIIERAHQILLSVALLPELRRDIEPEVCSRVLANKVKEGAVFVNMLVARPNGEAICNAIGTTHPINIADRDFFQRALQTHEFVVGGYIISRSTGKPAIGIAYPLLDEAGHPETVVSATLDIGWLEKELAKFNLPERSDAVVLGHEGTVLARHPDPEGWVGKAASADMPLVKTVLNDGGEGTADELGLDGVRRIFAFIPLHTATTGQVYLWVGIPKDAVVGPVERGFVRTVLIAFALLVLTFGAFWLGSERLFLRRIVALGKAATKLGKGELTARTGLQPGSDEIAQLAQSFDQMAEGLEAKERERRRAEQALRESQARLDLALRSARMGVWHLDIVENRRYFDAQACRLLGIDPATFTGAAEEFVGVVHPDDRETLRAALARTVEQDVLYEPEYRAVWPDGSVHYITARGRLVRDVNGRPAKINGIIWDVTARKQGELALERANRALRTLGACNVALVHAGNESELLNSICRLIVETGGYRMAWVGFPEQDPAKTVRAVAQYGHDEGYLEAAKISWADCERGRGPTGTAIRTGTVQVNQDFLTNPALAPWREAALKRGYRWSIALPLKNSAGTLVGVLTIYAPEPDAISEAEVALLQELADDLAFGIETLRTRADRDRIAYEHIHHAEILRRSLEDSIKAIADTVEMRDPYTAGHQKRVSQLAVAISGELGLPEETIHGIELAASIHDLGKISVPAEILVKPAKLTDIELMLIRNHAQAGYNILKDIKFPWPIATMVLQHHERLDGSGYPQGLKDGQILLESRIMAVADVVEALASHRPYRAALGVDMALKEIERGRGTTYDAAVVDACLRLFREKRFALST